jgi:uncharacterized protein (TIGR02271 family)
MNTPDASSDSTTADSGPAEIIRSEEQVQVHVISVPRSILRIRKVIVTEQQTITVTVRHEELRITEEPATATTADSGLLSETGEDELIIVLHEEQVDVRTRAIPVERVRVRRTRGERSALITESVRREQVQVVSNDTPTPTSRHHDTTAVTATEQVTHRHSERTRRSPAAD